MRPWGEGQVRLLIGALLLAGAGCRTFPKTPDATLSALASTKDGYLSGTPIALGERVVLNREDFVYDAKLSPDSKLAAVSRLGPKSFHLTLHELTQTPPKPRSDTAINPLEFDVDSVEFSPDGTRVATVSRDGALRIYDAQTGALQSAWLTEEPLVSVAWNSAGDLLALGSARGLVTLVSFPQLQHVAELRAHADEVRAVAFAPSGELVTGSWDRKLHVFSVTASVAPPRDVRTHVTRKNGVVTFRAVVDRAASATVALDARVPVIVIKPSLAQAAGINVLSLTESIEVPTAFGTQLAKVARGRTVSIKNLALEADLAVCDACVPAEAQAVLGGPVLDRLSVAFDESTSEIVFTAKEGARGVVMSNSSSLVLARSFEFPASVNDVSLDAKGEVAGVAFSETKSERTKAVYDREKKKEIEPDREWDCGARVDLASGKVLEKKTGHRGVVASVGISPDGKILATGGWDKKVILHGAPVSVESDYGWAIRRVRFSRDGRRLVVAAWTPQNPLNSHQSDPAAVVYEVVYGDGASVLSR